MSFFNQSTARLIPERSEHWSFRSHSVKRLFREERTRDLMKGAVVYTLATGKPVKFDHVKTSRTRKPSTPVSVDLAGLL